MLSKLRSYRPGHGTVVAYIALFVALGGTSYGLAKSSIGSREIKNNSVRSKDIRNNDVRGKDIRTGTIDSTDVGNGSLLTEDFKAGQLPTGPPGPRGLQGPKGDPGASIIPDGSITASKLANSAVISSKLANSSVNSSKLADSSVTQSKLGLATGFKQIPYDSTNPKAGSADCPAGKHLVGGAAMVVDGNDLPLNGIAAISYSGPVPVISFNSWGGYAYRTAASGNYGLDIIAYCSVP